MINLFRAITMLASAAFASLTVEAAQAAEVDWSEAANAYAVGEAQAETVFTAKTAAVCVGRWIYHGNAVDEERFPQEVSATFPEQLSLPYAIQAADFFRMDPFDEVAQNEAIARADLLLDWMLAGDEDAFQSYFEELGACSTQPEAPVDYPADAIDAPAN